MDTSDRPLVTEPTDSTAIIPIAQLSPDVDRLQQSSIHAVVTLLWPYSSSTKSLSLLLAEPDFRLRRSKGQVKVFFHGHIAEEVARTHIGIGDNVRLNLAGSRFANNDAVIQTPGKGVSWDLHFNASAYLEVWRNSEILATVKIDRHSTTPPPTDILPAAPSTPAVNGNAHAPADLSTASWQSPAFLERSRVSFGLTDPTLEPTIEEDGYVPGKGRKRPRFSMRSNEWRLVDEPESPRDRELPEDWMAIFDEELMNGSDAGEETNAQDKEDSVMPPSLETVPDVVAAEDIDAVMVDASGDTEADPSASATDKPTAITSENAQFLHPSIIPKSVLEKDKSHSPSNEGHLPTDTPRLHPIPSPGLPAPSPFPTVPSPGGYFVPMSGITAAAQTVTSSATVPEEELDPVEPATTSPVPYDGKQKRTDEVTVVSEATPQEFASAAPSPVQDDLEPAQTDKDDDASENVPEHDGSANSPRRQSDAEPAHDEDDNVTVYTDDVQVLPSSPLSSNMKVTKVATVEHKEVNDEAEVSSDLRGDTEAAIVPETRTREPEAEESESDESGSGAGESDSEDSESDGSGSEEAESESDVEQELQGKNIEKVAGADSQSSVQEMDRANAERLPKQMDQEVEYESDDVSEWSEDDEADAEAKQLQKHEIQRPARKASLSQKEIGDKSEDSSHSDRNDVEDGADWSEEEASDRYDYEENYDDDDEEEEEEEEKGKMRKQDRLGAEYGYSASEADSDIEDKLPSRPAPKDSEPEIIVLDSDSEDETSAQRTADKAVQGKDEPSEEDSHDSGEESLVEQEVSDKEGYENDGFQEAQENDGDYEREAEEYQLDEPMGDVGEDAEVNEYVVHEQSIDESVGPEQDPMDEDVYEDQITEGGYGAIQEHPEEGLGVRPAEPSYEAGHIQGHNDTLTSHEYLEGFQHTHGHPQRQQIHDSLDYLATVSESAQRLHSVSEAVNNGFDMAIDPNLYEFATPPVDPSMKHEERASKEASGENIQDVAIKSPRSLHEEHLALQLDGAAPSTIVSGISEERAIAPNSEDEQSIALGASQQINVEQVPEAHDASLELAPMPDLIQETLVRLKAEQHQEDLPETSALSVTEDRSPSPVVAIKSEDTPIIPEHEETEPAPPIVLVAPARSPSPSQDEMLQASIEVDEQTEEANEDTKRNSINRHYPGLRSKLSYFAPLATLIDHFNALVDTICAVSEVTPAIKADTGKKDFILTLQLTDSSMAGTTIYAQILRPFKQALPTVNEGDAILLRNFRVKSFDHSVILVSDDTSAWAVFSSSSQEPEVNGPPVEYGDEERNFAIDLRQWYVEDGLAMIADHQLQASVGREMSADNEESRANTPGSNSIAPSDAASIDNDMTLRESRGETSSSRGSRRRKSHRRITIHELRDGRRYTEVGSSPGDSSIHELRDGTVYANL